MGIRRNGSEPSARGPEDYFAGAVRIDAPCGGRSNLLSAFVTFATGEKRRHGASPDCAMSHIAVPEKKVARR